MNYSQLAPIGVAIFFGAPAVATETSRIEPRLEEIVVSASPHAKSEAEVAGSLNIIDGEELRREAASTLGETLQNQIGVHSSSFGPGVGVPVIRGQSGKRVEVLQNSTSVGDVSDTSSDHAVATEALLADRIEILRGPATLRYGPGAIGGVVNVIDNRIHTRLVEGSQGAAEIRHNSNNDETVAIGRFDFSIGNVGVHLDGVTRDSNNIEIDGLANATVDDPDETTNGFIANSDREADSFSLGLSWVGDRLVAGASVNRIDNSYGVPPGAHEHSHHEESHEEEHEEEHGAEEGSEELFTRINMDQTQYQGKLLFPDLGGYFDRLNIDLSYTDYRHRELEIEEGVAHVGTIFDADSTEIRAELVHNEISGWLGAFGVQYSQRDFSAVGEEAFAPPSDTERFGFYVLEETALGSASLELGARFDRQEIATAGISPIEHDSYNLSVSLLLPIADNQRFGFLLSRSERAPVAEELFSEGEHVATNTYEIGDANLDPESAINTELTWIYDAEITARASIFYTWFQDYIYAMDTESRFSHDLESEGFSGIQACSNDIADFENNLEEFEESIECFHYGQEDSTFAGIEAEISIPVADKHNLRVWGDYVRAKLDENGDVPRMPPARLGASWDIRSANWFTQLSITHAFAQEKPGEGQEETRGYTRLDAHLSYNLGDLALFIKGSNLTQEKIRNSTSLLRQLAPEPGRSITFGASYRF
ncbi:MAG: TonB-dependent receptor [Pseudomonadales bacterium]|nr:TonB-dependent receptor [Pseudomonadales bacterium]MCP5215518.1 TonB-dependent receptor [Pseudomonadales bacterium]